MKTKRGNEINTQLGVDPRLPKWYKGLIRVYIDQNNKPRINTFYQIDKMKEITVVNNQSKIIDNRLLSHWQPLRYVVKPVRRITTYELNSSGKDLLARKKRRNNNRISL